MKLAALVTAAMLVAAPAAAQPKPLLDALDAVSIPIAYVFLCEPDYGALDPRILERLVTVAEARGYVKSDELHRAYIFNETKNTMQRWGEIGIGRMCRTVKREMDATAKLLRPAP